MEKFGQFVKETHLKLHELFPWIRDNESVHALLGHITKSIEENNGYGFGQKWEGTLEAVHQLIRLYRKSVTRKTNETACKKDLFNRLLIQSNQRIRAILDLIKPKKRNITVEPSEDDIIVESFFMETQENFEIDEEPLEVIVEEDEEPFEIDNEMEVEE